jgi:outer membrane protein
MLHSILRLLRLLLSVVAVALLVRTAPAQTDSVTNGGTTLTLDDAIHLALSRNRALRVVSFGRGISRANLLVARGQFDPAIQFQRSDGTNLGEASYTPPLFETVKSDTYSLNLVGVTPIGTAYTIGGNTYNARYEFNNYANNYQSFGGFQVTQHLLKGFGFGANLAQVRIQKANRTISDLQYRLTAIGTVTSVIVAYSNLELAHDALGVAEKTRELAGSLLEDNEKEFKIGSIARSDVIQARAQFAALEEPVLIYERGVRDAENALRELIGEDVFFEDKPLFTLAPLTTPEVTVDRHADLSTALMKRPDYLVARLNIVQYKASEAAALNGVLPQVDFVGGYGYNGISQDFAASRQQVYDKMNPSFSAGIAVTLPITNAVGRGTLRAARLTRRQSEEALLSTAANIAVAVATADGQIETTRKRVAADQSAYDLAKQALDAEEKRKKAGTSTTLQVQQVQQNLAAVEFNLSTAVAAERQAVAIYDQTLGTTLERYNITLTSD